MDELNRSESIESSPRVLSLVLLLHGDRILLMKGKDHLTGRVFYRPLGGGIRLGETAEKAACRELLEEMDFEVKIEGLIGVTESQFVCHGRPGHEIVFEFVGRAVPRTDCNMEDLLLRPPKEPTLDIVWVPQESVCNSELPIMPLGLGERLSRWMACDTSSNSSSFQPTIQLHRTGRQIVAEQ